MLFLTRKIGQSIIINDEIELQVIEVQGKIVKLGFSFPPHAKILRQEVYERIQEENRQATENALRIQEALKQDDLGPFSAKRNNE